MNQNYTEIPCSTVREYKGKKYLVKRFGVGGEIFEEHLIPIPIDITVRVFKTDGTEDVTEKSTKPKK